MENNKQTKEQLPRDAAYWMNEVTYFESLMDGVQTVYAFAKRMRDNALDQTKQFQSQATEEQI